MLPLHIGLTHCVTCHEYITDRGWAPCCCEVCWDSADADEMRFFDRIQAAEQQNQPDGQPPVT